MTTINLTEPQIRNLLIFLNRVNISGAESEVLTELKIILGRTLQTQGVVQAPIKKDKTEQDGKK